METIQEIIDTIKQWPATIWWVMGALFIIPRFWDTPPRKKRNKDKMTDDKNNDLKSSNMTDKKEFGGNLMEEGVIMWAIFTKEGKQPCVWITKYIPRMEKSAMEGCCPPMYPYCMKSSHRMMLTGFFPFLNTGFRYGSGCAYDIGELRTG